MKEIDNKSSFCDERLEIRAGYLFVRVLDARMLATTMFFWLTIVPFTTAFIGDYPTNSVVVAIYGWNLCLAGLCFMLMGRRVLFKSDLRDPAVLLVERRREFRRSWWGVVLYGLAEVLAFVWVYAALVILAIIPFIYVVPYLMQTDS